MNHDVCTFSVNINLRLYNPIQVLEVLTKDREVLRWLDFISNHYLPEPRRVLLIYPCSTKKPYHESRSYKVLFKTLASLGELRREVHLVTVSEPFALVPEEFYGRRTKWHDWGNSWYDCPGLFSWWCRKHNQPYRLDYVEKCIDILSDYVAGFFRRTRTFYKVRIAFVRTCTSSLRVTRDHTHLAIIKRASEKSGIDVDIQPPKEVVKEIVARYGRLAWDYRGISHSLAQEYLKSLLLAKLGG